MYLREIKLSSFRNFADLVITPGLRLNILYGANAQGKTNILEAIALGATTRSLRATHESEMVRHGDETATVALRVARTHEADIDLQVSVYGSDKKAAFVNGLRRPRIVDLLGELNVVCFTAADIEMVRGEPTQRRHFMNMEISQISPGYVHHLSQYKRVLEQRNRLIRDLRDRPRSAHDAGLGSWDAQLATHGAAIMEKRQAFVEELAPLADDIHRELTSSRDRLEIRYVPSVKLSGQPEEWNCDEIARQFQIQLSECYDDELRRGVTLIGPQRDDLSFAIEGLDARTYGSQGQQRTVTLALKLAEYRLFERNVGEPPVLLLDDVMSDLDDSRKARLLQWIDARGQIVATATSLADFSPATLVNANTYCVSGGLAVQDESR